MKIELENINVDFEGHQHIDLIFILVWLEACKKDVASSSL
jgi:hypothetical protein